MKKIEDYWEDTEVYSIKFRNIENKVISKIIVVSMGYSKEDIKDIILFKFNKVKEVLVIEILGESLLLKDEKCDTRK